MKSTTCTRIVAITIFAALGGSLRLSAQEERGHCKHPAYVLKDLGTFGGPNSFFFSAPVVQSVNNRGTVVGGADLPAGDPFAPSCFNPPDCHTIHAFHWHRGVLEDLGTLPGGSNSAAFWVNEHGLVMGGSENGVIDPVFGGPQQFTVLWKDGQIVNLGSLGGGFSGGNAMNERGEVVGIAANAIPDPFSFLSFLGVGTQTRAFLWRNGVMLDLGTLGGPDSWAASVNERGQVVGWALVDSTVNSKTGQPTQHPFLWENGRMIDIQTLGGSSAVVGSLQNPGAGASLNNRGQVIGTSNLLGDASHHPFLWERGILTDLGTLGGDNGEGWWINENGEIVGRADLPGSKVHHAFLWHNGKMIDLGTAPNQPCSTAIEINARSQVIVDTGICGVGGGPGMLWENGKLYDLNSLLRSKSGISVRDVNFISDRGEIAATGLLPSGDQHAILLIPCDQDHLGRDDCDTEPADATTYDTGSVHTSPVASPTGDDTKLSPAKAMSRFRSMMTNRSRRYGSSQRP